MRVAWSPDGTRAAVSWNVGRIGAVQAGGSSIGRGHLVVVSRRAIATVDLLDAGGAGVVDALGNKIEGAGFRVGHRGKAGQARSATEVYFAPGFEAEARELAKRNRPGIDVWQS